MGAYLFVLLCATAIGAAPADLDTLLFVHAIWRHGDRSPAHGSFPTDKGNGEETWPQGWGELSAKGINQQYELGRFLRNRYDGFISAQYDSKQVYVRSTSYNRTLMSALANMAGLFEPKGSQIWNPQLSWQPIPVHSRPKMEDPMLVMNVPCPAEDKLWEETKNLPAVKEISEKNAEFLAFLASKSGAPVLSVLDMSHVYDPLVCEMNHNITNNGSHQWPDWVTWEVFMDIERLYDIEYGFYFYTKQMQRFRGGMLLGDILNRMEAKEQSIDSNLKFYAYSAHDTTLTALLESLGAFNDKHPPYASVILIELHKIDQEFTVQVHYKNETGPIVHRLSVSDCSEPCTLNEFAQRTLPIVPENWRKECGLDLWLGLDSHAWFRIVVCLCGLLLLVVLFLSVSICCLCNERRKRYAGRSLVPDSPTSDA